MTFAMHYPAKRLVMNLWYKATCITFWGLLSMNICTSRHTRISFLQSGSLLLRMCLLLYPIITYEELSAPGTAATVMLRALFMQFLVKILRNYAPDSNAAITYIPIPLVKAYILIEDSFLLEYNTITLKELSHRLGLSSRQTSRILYNRYGKNFLQKRTEARMAAAVTFLKENKLSISEISARLGYSYPNHFHTAFKNYYHMTISEYKERILM